MQQPWGKYIGTVYLLTLLCLTHSSLISEPINVSCPPCLCRNVTGCIQADCSGKELQRIPESIPPPVCTFILKKNNLGTLYDYEFLNFTVLKYLDLSESKIRKIEKNAFKHLQQLHHLDLSNNFISDSDRSVTEPLKQLQFLDISKNYYPKYPVELLRNLVSLKYLIIDAHLNESFDKGFGNLKYLTSLKLSCFGEHHNVQHLYNDTFLYLSSLTHLNVSYCRIETIEPGTFAHLTNLTSLDLSGNKDLHFCGVQNATYGLQFSNIRRLLINQVHGDFTVSVIVTKKHVQFLQNTSIEEIQANNNRIEVFEREVFEYLPNTLKNVSIFSRRYTRGPFLLQLYKLKGLTHLDLSGKAPGLQNSPFGDFPTGNGILRSNVFTNDYLQSDSRNRYCISDSVNLKRPLTKDYTHEDHLFRVPPNLTHFKYAYGGLAFILGGIKFAENKLEHVDLSTNIFTRWLGPISGLENITYLDLSNNIASVVSPNFFANFSSLTHLNISRNLLGQSVLENTNGGLFRNLTKLKVLNASLNGIRVLNSSFLSNLKFLEELHVANNSIYAIDLAFITSKHLKFINISYNQIKVIDSKETTKLEELSKSQRIELDFTGNPFLCNCFNVDFIEWLISPKYNITVYNYENYFCLNADETWHFSNIKDLRQKLKRQCATYFGLSMSVLAVVVLITSIMMSGIVYRYRWKLMYWYYVAKLSWKKGNNQDVDCDEYQCKAYVSYAEEDLPFVRYNMIDALEKKRQLPLNIRDRDSMPGVAIAENMINGIHNSKKTLILLSKNFLKSKWCHYEMHTAVFEGISRTKSTGVVIVVMLEDVRKESIPPEIMYQVQNNSFIQYPQSEEDDNLNMFWNDLTTAIMA